MTWTSEPPTKPGWYWIRINGNEADIVRINKRTVHGKKHLTISSVGENYALPIEWLTIKFKYEWAGSIEEPEDNKENVL